MISTKRILQIGFLLFLIIASIYIIRNEREPAEYKNYEGQVFGTSFHITYQSRDNLDQGIMRQLKEVDQSLSAFNPKSTLSLINSNQSKATDPMLREVFQLAENVSEKTQGAFDITVAPLVNAWGFGFKNKENVTSQLIDSIKSLVGYKKVRLENNWIVKDDPRLMMDCSGIAKGFGCDKAAKFLDKKNVKNYMVEIGGEICAKGVNKEGKTWNIGIIRPNDSLKNETNAPLQTVVPLKDAALATSGNYRNFYYEGGKKYAHTINPETGRPVQHSLLSATVIASSCAEADAFATAFMVMGLEKAIETLQTEKQLDAYFIYSDSAGNYQTWQTPQFAN